MSSEETVVAKECLDNANETATTHFNEAENGEDEIADTVVLEDEEPIPSRRGSHSSKQPYAASKVLQRVRRGYATAIGRCFMTAQALAQAVRVGKSYKPIKKPNGPTEGTELWEDNYKLLLQSDLTDKKDLYARIKRSFLPTHPLSLSYFESRVKRPRRKLKLMLLGDSLVCGLGCDNDDEGPVMPYIIAKCMSLQYEADVSWNSYGLNAATVAMLRTLLPKVQEGYNSRKDDEEVILLIICGLNDWKTLLEKFPHGSGPIGFRKNLQTLLGELRVFLGQKCRVFLAGVPISCTALDPKASLQKKPLKYFIDFISHTWDFQKKEVVAQNCGGFQLLRYIPAPDLSEMRTKPYATPGPGNVCNDGVHPSTQGYEWFALHMFDHIQMQMDIETAALMERSV